MGPINISIKSAEAIAIDRLSHLGGSDRIDAQTLHDPQHLLVQLLRLQIVLPGLGNLGDIVGLFFRQDGRQRRRRRWLGNLGLHPVVLLNHGQGVALRRIPDEHLSDQRFAI